MIIRLPDLNAVFVCPQKVASTSIKRAILRSFNIPVRDGKKWEKANSIVITDIGDEDILVLLETHSTDSYRAIIISACQKTDMALGKSVISMILCRMLYVKIGTQQISILGRSTLLSRSTLPS